MAVAFSAFTFAADDALARITLTGTTSGGQAQIILIENSAYSAGYDNGYDAPCNINLAEDLPKTLHIYSYIGAYKYSTIATNNLDGLHVDFITNLLDDEYKMTFEVFTLASGRTLDIYDLDKGIRTDIDPAESYTFEATKGHNEIKDRFVINYSHTAPDYVIMNGDFITPGGSWAYTSNFTDNLDGSFSLDLDLAADTWYHFQLEEGYGSTSYIAADGTEFNSTNASHNLTVDGWHSALLLHTDVAGTYTFTWYELGDNLTITFPAAASTGYTVTPNAAGYATFSADEATVIPAGATVYRGEISGEELRLYTISGYVPANTGVIVAGAGALDFEIATVTVPALSEDNDLKPTSAYNTSLENVYVLKGDAFLKYVGSDPLADNKAFIQLPSAPAGAPQHLRMVINGPQDIESVEAENVKAEKFIEDGQIFIRRDNKVYNVQGQIVK